MTTIKPNRRWVLGGAMNIALLSTAAPVWAHRLARTETEVTFKDDGSVAVIHSYHVQDVQDALYAAQTIESPDMGSLRNRAKLALYTEQTFSLKIDDQAIPLEIVGAEVAGATVYVYQEAQNVPSGKVSIEATMLRELIKGQQNSVNVEIDGETQTLDFKGDDGMKSLS